VRGDSDAEVFEEPLAAPVVKQPKPMAEPFNLLNTSTEFILELAKKLSPAEQEFVRRYCDFSLCQNDSEKQDHCYTVM
jgi:hypothetical protein